MHEVAEALESEPFRCFFVAGTTWGRYERTARPGQMTMAFAAPVMLSAGDRLRVRRA